MAGDERIRRFGRGDVMTVKPMLFNAPMIRALLDGRKTQTRLTLKYQPGESVVLDGGDTWGEFFADELNGFEPLDLPYDKGDLLWVREAYCQYDEGVLYKAGPLLADDALGASWTRAIRMPRRLSRLTLEVTDVRVQRLQDLSEEDVIAEGILRGDPLPELPESKGQIWASGIGDMSDPFEWSRSPRVAFSSLWRSIHGPGAWDANPWVAAITFKVHLCNVDELLKQRGAA